MTYTLSVDSETESALDPRVLERWEKDAIPLHFASMQDTGITMSRLAVGHDHYWLHRIGENELRLTTDGTPSPWVPKPSSNSWGGPLWEIIHRLPWTHTTEEWPAVIDGIAARIPRGTCKCRPHWLKWRAEHPWDFSGVEGCFRSGWEVHDAISARIGRKRITLEEAWLLWS